MRLKGFTLVGVICAALAILALWPESGAADATTSSDSLNVVVAVSGKSYDGDPQLGLVVDGKLVGQSAITANHDKDEWQALTFTLPVQTKPQSIGVAFLNGGAAASNGRGLYVRYITVNGTSIEPEDGVYQATNDAKPSTGTPAFNTQQALNPEHCTQVIF